MRKTLTLLLLLTALAQAPAASPSIPAAGPSPTASSSPAPAPLQTVPTSPSPVQTPASPGAPLSLDQARQEAQETSPTLRKMQARVDQAHYKIDEAYSGAYPHAELQAGYYYLTPTKNFDTSQGTLPILVTNNYTAGVMLEQVISSFGRLHYATLAAQMAEKSAHEELRREREELRHQVSGAFAQVTLAQAELELARQNAEVREAHQKQVELFLQAGTVPPFDGVQAKAAVAQAHQEVLETENRLAVARARLASLLGRKPAELAPLDAPLAPPAEKGSPDGRPEMVSLQWALEAARAKLGLEESQSNPRLAFQTRYQRQNTTAFQPEQMWTVGVQFSVPLFDGGLSDARENQAQAAVTELQETLAETRRMVDLEVEQAYLNLQTRWKAIEVADIRRHEAEVALHMADLRYQAGLSTSLELLDAQTAAFQAQIQAERTRTDYRLAWFDWERAVSGPGSPVEEPTGGQSLPPRAAD